MDELACNYDPLAAINIQANCFYIEYYCPLLEYPEYYDCECKCINDEDEDSVCDELDNCPNDYNPNQEDFDSDEIGDACDDIGLNQDTINRQLIKVTDVLGRDINIDSKKSVLLYIYDDGSVERRYILK